MEVFSPQESNGAQDEIRPVDILWSDFSGGSPFPG